MTAPARITQADMERAAKAVAAAKFVHAKIVMDLKNGRIEIILGESGEAIPPAPVETWDDDDV
ncbi:hypothetical protein [Novosphingobium sp. KN65.2]|uniref:hypothetical protein n=1 Tax=Novosphingobium sp. KN65.2 TaxID=1478134 RepID=UPI0005DE2C93|nr:hypothetical protein [Novosphingobium sp. KN65.2]CDO34752.1 hypothetical protein SPHV1_190045 [Novosphingobium sp. KN65.2]